METFIGMLQAWAAACPLLTLIAVSLLLLLLLWVVALFYRAHQLRMSATERTLLELMLHRERAAHRMAQDAMTSRQMMDELSHDFLRDVQSNMHNRR